jgi:hypothetical protein
MPASSPYSADTAYWDDGSSATTYSISTTSVSHIYHPHYGCIDYDPRFVARNTVGDTATDYTRVLYQR